MLQGCILSPLLFNMFLELKITRTLKDKEIDMQINGVRINNLCFTDDTALLAESLNDLQAMENRVVSTDPGL